MENGCILVVDDDKDIVAAIAKLLEKEDFEVIRAYDGLDALDKLASNRNINLILIDIHTKHLRTHFRKTSTCNQAYIACSNYCYFHIISILMFQMLLIEAQK